VDAAGGDEEFHAVIIKDEVPDLAVFDGELCAARTMFRIGIFVLPAGVVEDGEKADGFDLGGVMLTETEAVAEHGHPVGGSVDGIEIEAELLANELPERDFCGREHELVKAEKLKN